MEIPYSLLFKVIGLEENLIVFHDTFGKYHFTSIYKPHYKGKISHIILDEKFVKYENQTSRN